MSERLKVRKSFQIITTISLKDHFALIKISEFVFS